MTPPPAQRDMSERAGSTVREAAGSHAIYVSRPDAVADLIKQAAKGLEVGNLGNVFDAVSARIGAETASGATARADCGSHA